MKCVINNLWLRSCMYVLCSTLCHYYLLLCYFLITRLMVFNTLHFCILVLYVFFCIHCFVLFCVLFLLLYIAVAFLYFSHVYRPLPPGGNPTALNKYHNFVTYHPAVFFRHLRLAMFSLPHGKRIPDAFQRCYYFNFNCVSWGVTVHVAARSNA